MVPTALSVLVVPLWLRSLVRGSGMVGRRRTVAFFLQWAHPQFADERPAVGGGGGRSVWAHHDDAASHYDAVVVRVGDVEQRRL